MLYSWLLNRENLCLMSSFIRGILYIQIHQSEPPINHRFLNVFFFPSNSKSIPTPSTSNDRAFSYWTKKSEVTGSKLSLSLSFCTASSIASYPLSTILHVFILFPFRIINDFFLSSNKFLPFIYKHAKPPY